MLCSCCVSPVFASLAENSVRLGPALGLMLAAPSLNPASLAVTFMLFDLRIASTRLLAALAAVLLVGPIVELYTQKGKMVSSDALPDKPLEGNPVSLFLRSLASIFIKTVPGVIVGVIASMLLVQYLPAHLFDAPGAKL